MGGEGQILTKSRRKSVDHLVKSKNHKARVGCSETSDSGAPCGLAFQALCILFLVYAGFFWATRRALYGVHVAPLPQNASLDQFSEGRTMKHIRYLADDIGIRQEGSIGLIEAAKYIKLELEYCKQRASNSVRVDIDQSFVYGSFNMIFLKHSITLAYKNHTNIAIRVCTLKNIS
ncbi:hypothetical protein KP509_04G098200 [Ceratopteris richardii]|uniref:Uncharacterized protein n=1 Tax=Ceratopteris richardii TaxID=49495 RepID=A0A8T2V7H6_CERRI|nr:hypothetical protein KP509_04G098200 [Ceratopteris richardii]